MESIIAGWLILSTIICTWDSGFILLRPHSMPLGDLEYLWMPYSLYISVDQRYGNMDMEDEFVVAQTWCNLFECVLNIIAAVLLLRRHNSGILIGFLVTVMTFWKTVIYGLLYTPLCTNSHPFQHVSWRTFMMVFLIPNGVWIVIPFMVMMYLGQRILNIMNSKKKTN